MLKKSIYVAFLATIVGVGGTLGLKYRLPIGPTVLILGIVPVLGLIFAKRSFKGAIPDFIFGAIDTGLLVIPALAGGFMWGVAGALAGAVIGDALTDAIAGFFEGAIAKALREKGIEESREPVVTSLGKMAGCLLGSGIVLTAVLPFGIHPKFA